MNKIIKDFLRIGSGTLISMFIGLLTTPIITRLVVPSEYGQYSLFLTYSNIAVMILCLGLDQGLVRYFYEKKTLTYKRELVQTTTKYPIIFTVFLGLISFLLFSSDVINLPFDEEFAVLLFIHVLIQIIYRFSLVVIRLEHQSKLYSTLNVANKLFYVIFVFVFIYLLGRYSVSLILAAIISSLITLVISIVMEKKIWKPSLSGKDEVNIPTKEILQYSFPFIFTMGLTTLFNANDKLFLDYFSTYEAIGVFSAATSISAIINIIQSTFNTLWAPVALDNYANNPDDKSLYFKGNQLITVVMFFVGLTVILFKDVFVLLLGEQYRSASYVLPMLLFGPIMNTISETTVLGLIFKKKSNVQLVISGITYIIDVILNVIFIPRFGAIGAAISTGLSYIIFFTLRTLFANRYYYIDFRLKEFFFLTLISVSYAVYTSFVPFNIMYIIGYLICIGTLLFLYRDTLRNSLEYAVSIISERRK